MNPLSNPNAGVLNAVVNAEFLQSESNVHAGLEAREINGGIERSA